MTSRTYPAAAVCFFALAFSSQTAGAVRPLPTPEEAVARHVAARGGVEAWKRITSIRRAYEISGLTIEGLWAAERARMDVFGDDRSEVSAVDATSGWVQRSWEGRVVRPLTADAVSDVRERAALGFELFLVKGPGYVRYKINEALDPAWFQKPK